jgi:hypothetical protein
MTGRREKEKERMPRGNAGAPLFSRLVVLGLQAACALRRDVVLFRRTEVLPARSFPEFWPGLGDGRKFRAEAELRKCYYMFSSKNSASHLLKSFFESYIFRMHF